jgi:hypothetical protein
MGYIIVTPQGPFSSAERAAAISRELYCITAPIAVQEPYQADGNVFGVIAHPDGVQHALVVRLDYEIAVHNQAKLDELVALFPIMDPQEIQALADFILTSSLVTFQQIIPSDVTVYDEAYMVAQGWFPNPQEL